MSHAKTSVAGALPWGLAEAAAGHRLRRLRAPPRTPQHAQQLTDPETSRRYCDAGQRDSLELTRFVGHPILGAGPRLRRARRMRARSTPWRDQSHGCRVQPRSPGSAPGFTPEGSSPLRTATQYRWRRLRDGANVRRRESCVSLRARLTGAHPWSRCRHSRPVGLGRSLPNTHPDRSRS